MQKSETAIREILGAINGQLNGVDANADLHDSGLTSVHAITLLAALEEHFTVSVPDDEFIKARSISQLTAMIDSLVEHSVA